MSSCDGLGALIVTTASEAPLASDARWAPCTTAELSAQLSDGAYWMTGSVSTHMPGDPTLFLSLPDLIGAFPLRVRAVDQLGNQGFTALGTVELVACNPAQLPFGGGYGMDGHPFRICTIDQLKQVSDHGGGSFRLDSDLDLTGATVSLGILNWGTFDGNGHTLSHYSLSSSDHGSSKGLFDIVAPNGDAATVANLTLQVDGFSAIGWTSVGALVGSLATVGRIVNCHVLLAGTVEAFDRLGGLVGMSAGSISGASVSGISVTCPSGFGVGGIAGIMDAPLSNSHVSQVAAPCSRSPTAQAS